MDTGQSELNTRPAGHDKPTDTCALIEGEIDRTRDRMDRTVDAIQNNLSFRSLTDRVLASLSSGAGAGSRRLLKGVRNNPVPATLVGLGIVWLIMDQARRRSHAHQGTMGFDPSREDEPYKQPDAGRLRNTAAKAGEWFRGAGEGISSAASSAASSIREGASHVGGRIRHTAEAAGHKVSERAAAVAAQAKDAALWTRHAATDAYEANPLAVGAGAFVVGLAAGLLIPGTQAENRLMGRASRQVKDRAKDAGREAIQAGQEVASRAVEGAREGVGQGGNIGERLANAAGSAATAAAEGIRSGAEEIASRAAGNAGRDAGARPDPRRADQFGHDL